ncbi:MAG: PEP-CTERM sorting domain-containing protein [Phycisphaerales bacterium]|nr:PEP-CTERM sorting domain-containing protein [Phycisphaerales bacterium]
MKKLALAAALAVSAAAFANIPLLNADIESNVTGQFGAIANWGPNGGWAPHAGFPTPTGLSGDLGGNFGFYSANTTETVGQLLPVVFEPNTTYRFYSYAIGGGNRLGAIPYQIGYAEADGPPEGRADFSLLATQVYDLDGVEDFILLDGVTYTTGATGDELGKQIWVRLGDGAAGGRSDIWFDSFALVPEPASFLLLGLGLLAARRR